MTAYLTDAAFWVTVCAAHLLEIGARASGDDADETAADLFEDPDYRSLQPRAAAVAFQAWHRHRNFHGERGDRDEPRGVVGPPARNACADQGMPPGREDATNSTTVRWTGCHPVCPVMF